jgi:hypothetical protein
VGGIEELMSNHAMIPRRAFTLIELMIAVTLSMMIVYTSFAAFRVAAQSVATCKRLSIENGMLRTGFFAALEELDYWDLYDDRNSPNPSANPLRAPGKPFCPMSYDPTRKESDPRTWWRGYGFSTDVSNAHKWGNWASLSRAGHSDAVRAWYPNQIKHISEKLGGYGMISYLPGDAIYCWYESGGSPYTIKGQPRDIWERTSHTPVTVNGNAYDKGNRGDYLPSRPVNWPGLQVETRRYAVWSSYIDLCQIEVTSPITGESTRLSFWGVGTSLRGARQQRGLDTVVLQ